MADFLKTISDIKVTERRSIDMVSSSSFRNSPTKSFHDLLIERDWIELN